MRIGPGCGAERWARRGLASALSVALLAAAMPIQAQEGWSAEAGPVLAKRLSRDGGPGAGAVGIELRVRHGPLSGRSWGIGLGFLPTGRFDNPVPGDWYEERLFTVGPRLRQPLSADGRASVTLGADVALVRNSHPIGDPGSDPAVGASAALGYLLSPEGSVRWLLEAGVRVLAATGELTAGSGTVATLMLGVAF